MSGALIRFHCACGKRVAAPAKFAGRKAKCPRCGEEITVPDQNPEPENTETVAIEEREPCKDSRLDAYYGLILETFEGRVEEHGVARGNPHVRFLLPDHRRQGIELSIEQNEQGHELLVVRSEIGTVTLFEEAATALRLNRDLQSGRLYLDDSQVLQLEHCQRIDEVDEKEFIRIVKVVARWADEFEEQLFGMDLR